MTQLRLNLFGSPYLERQGKNIDLRLRKAIALLVYLVITHRKISRDELATMFWPESDPSSARANLRRTLYIINKCTAEDLLTTSKDTVTINPSVEVWTDVETFRRIVAENLPQESASADFIDHRIALLEQAVILYQGDFLTGFSLPDSPSFDEWQFFEAQSLQSDLSLTLEWLASIFRSQGDHKSAIEHARHWLALDDFHEPAHRLLMSLYAESGQQAAALRQFEECKRILDQELGVSPQPETINLYQKIRTGRDTSVGEPKKLSPDIYYVPSGDVHIAYVVLGDGPVDILGVYGYITHMEHIWDLPQVSEFFEKLTTFSRVIQFDRRGVGLSDRIGYAPSIEDTQEDILAVIRATNAKRPVLFGYLEGGPTSMLFAATYPEHVAGLILYGTRAKWTRSEDYPWAITREQYDRWLQQITEHWGESLNLDTYAPSHANQPQLQAWWSKLMRLASSPGAVKAVLEVMREIDVRDILPAIRVPTLILQRRDDRAIRVGAGRHLAGQIPGARYVELDGDDHWFFFGDTEPILQEIRSFIETLGTPTVPEWILATILLVEYQNEAESENQITHTLVKFDPTYAYLHQEVARFRGSEVSCQGGCYMATFDAPTRAIHCAQAIMKATDQWQVNICAGLHTGECEYLAGELVGMAVKIVKGLMSYALNREILVSSTVKDLVVGSSFQFIERSRQVIEGVSGEWGIFVLEGR